MSGARSRSSLEQRVERARRLAFAAFRPAGLGRRASRRRCRNAARPWRPHEAWRNSAAVIEPAKPPLETLLRSAILRIEQRVVGPPQRQAPERDRARAGACRAIVGGERVVVGVERRQLRPERDAGGAGQRGEVDEQVRGSPRRRAPARRPGSGGPRRRCCRSRPSGPCGSVDVAGPEGVAGDRRSRRPGSARAAAPAASRP